jgi:hypothetical protein
VQRLLVVAMSVRDPDTARAIRAVVFLLLLGEALAVRRDRRGPRSISPGQAPARPQRRPLPRRGAVAGRRPRG